MAAFASPALSLPSGAVSPPARVVFSGFEIRLLNRELRTDSPREMGRPGKAA
jgi:hypothetical protein